MSATTDNPSRTKPSKRSGGKPRNRNKWSSNWRLSREVKRHGYKETLDTIDILMDPNVDLETAVDAAEHHKAFVALERSDQIKIHKFRNDNVLWEFTRRLINALCFKYNLVQIRKDSDTETWPDTVAKLHVALDD
jgi:hypothetical protein